MKENLLQNLRSKFLKALESIVNVINQLPSFEENRRAYSSAHRGANSRTKKKSNSPVRKKEKLSKEVYEHKGSGYKGKGKINTDTHTFNQPRKSGAAGKTRSSH